MPQRGAVLARGKEGPHDEAMRRFVEVVEVDEPPRQCQRRLGLPGRQPGLGRLGQTVRQEAQPTLPLEGDPVLEGRLAQVEPVQQPPPGDQP